MSLLPVSSGIIQLSHFGDLYKIFRTFCPLLNISCFIKVRTAVSSEGLLTLSRRLMGANEAVLGVTNAVHRGKLLV